MRNGVPVTGKRSGRAQTVSATGGRARRAALAMVLLVSACGGNSKDNTRDTQGRSDASVDAGEESSVDASGGGASSLSADTDAGLTSNRSGLTTQSTNDMDSANDSATTSASSSGAATDTGTPDTVTTSTDSTSDTSTTLQPGWVAIEPIADGLSNCAAKPQEEETWCTDRVECDSVALTSTCYLVDGEWDCTCKQGFLPQRTYTVTGADAERSPCEVSIVLCAPSRPAEPEPECNGENDSVSSTSCSGAKYCRTTIELEDGVTAVVLEKDFYTNCNLDSGLVECSCDSGYVRTTMVDIPLENACRLLVPWCQDGFPEPDAETEYVCPHNYASSGDQYCSISRSCGPRLDVDDGYVVYAQEDRYISCDGEFGCSCSSSDYISGLPTGSLQGERCEVMEEFCHGGVNAVPTGEVSVVMTSTGGGNAACSGTVTGRQSASWGEDRSISLTGTINTNCTHEAGETWTCACSSAQNETESFTVEGEEFDDTCNRALDRCMARARIVPSAALYYYGFAFEFLPESSDADAGP